MESIILLFDPDSVLTNTPENAKLECSCSVLSHAIQSIYLFTLVNLKDTHFMYPEILLALR